jgi:hypothetical protein
MSSDVIFHIQSISNGVDPANLCIVIRGKCFVFHDKDDRLDGSGSTEHHKEKTFFC